MLSSNRTCFRNFDARFALLLLTLEIESLSFSIIMQLVQEVSGIDLTSILGYLSSAQQPFRKSELYSSVSETKFVDENLRQSRFRTFEDPVLFDLVDEVITKHINHSTTANPSSKQEAVSIEDFEDEEREDKEKKVSKISANRFFLLRNDATHIVYEAGGFFKRHQDYLSLTSNIVEEYTLIICVTPASAPPAVGGETVVHINPSTAHRSTATTTLGSALVFRKDLEHESMPLISGEKHILTLNLWATRAQSQRFLLVCFPSSSTEKRQTTQASEAISLEQHLSTNQTELKSNNDNSSDSKLSALHKLANGSSYVIPVSDVMAFPDCMLARFINFADSSSSSSPPSAVLVYQCENASYTEFGLIYRILCRQRVLAEEVVQHASLINYFITGL